MIAKRSQKLQDVIATVEDDGAGNTGDSNRHTGYDILGIKERLEPPIG